VFQISYFGHRAPHVQVVLNAGDDDDGLWIEVVSFLDRNSSYASPLRLLNDPINDVTQ
jgi:hypothetical protein